jgi:uncharacterized protein YbaP (TraB family)
MLRQFFRRAFAFVSLGIAALSAPAAAEARPALWAVSDRDTTIYLFGTIHLLPKNTNWQGAALDKAVADSSDLVIETIVDQQNPTPLMQTMMTLATSPGLAPLRDRVSADKRPALDAAIKASGIPIQTLDGMETWAAAFLLLGVQFRDIGAEGGEGAEMVLRKAFTDSGKSIGELETNAEQLGFFDRLPESAQVALLEGALSSGKDVRTEFVKMLDAWTSGDVDRIAKTFDVDLADSPPLRDALMVQRNRNWAGWIKRRMAVPGVTLVAVGAGHLAGKDSVIAMLKESGFQIRRIQ